MHIEKKKLVREPRINLSFVLFIKNQEINLQEKYKLPKPKANLRVMQTPRGFIKRNLVLIAHWQFTKQIKINFTAHYLFFIIVILVRKFSQTHKRSFAGNGYACKIHPSCRSFSFQKGFLLIMTSMTSSAVWKGKWEIIANATKNCKRILNEWL